MKYKVAVSFFALITCVSSSTSVKTQTKNVESNKNLNSIRAAQKVQTIYAMPMPMIHQQPLLNYMQQPYQSPPQATILFIAQPVSPQHLFQHPVAQQLLNYFHSNPQAKYQFLHGPAPTAQTYVQQPIPDSYTNQQLNYQQPQPNQQYVTSQRFLPQESLYRNPQSAQSYQPYPSQAVVKTAPPIFTGLENFSPEQQAQIKDQLSAHFGSQLTQINPNSFQVPSSPQVAEKKSDLDNQKLEKRHLGRYLNNT